MKTLSLSLALVLSLVLAGVSAPVKDALGGKSTAIIGGEAGIVSVEYLESTGTQWIDTRVYGGDGTFADTRVRRLTKKVNECFLGAWNNGQNRLWLCYTFSSQWYPGYGNVARGVDSAADTEWHDISLITNTERYIGYLIDGEDYYVTIGRYTTGFVCSNPILMFAMGTNTGADYLAIGQIARCKIFQNGVLVRDFQPVRVGSTGFMLDLVSGELFGNMGTGDFVIGPDKEEL